MRSFGREIHIDGFTLENALKAQINLKNNMDKFKESTKPQIPLTKKIKALTFGNVNRPFKGRKKIVDGFKSEVFKIRHPLNILSESNTNTETNVLKITNSSWTDKSG